MKNRSYHDLSEFPKKKKKKKGKWNRFGDVTAQRLVIQWLTLDVSILIKPPAPMCRVVVLSLKLSHPSVLVNYGITNKTTSLIMYITDCFAKQQFSTYHIYSVLLG